MERVAQSRHGLGRAGKQTRERGTRTRRARAPSEKGSVPGAAGQGERPAPHVHLGDRARAAEPDVAEHRPRMRCASGEDLRARGAVREPGGVAALPGPAGGVLRVVRGRGVDEMEAAELSEAVRGHDDVIVDLGTGDGRFVLREARERPRSLVVGIDPVAEAMGESARRAARRPVRGGAPNALFLVAAVEDLPRALDGTAGLVAVNFPWGSLLAGVARPEPEIMTPIARLLRPEGRLVPSITLSAASDSDYSERLELPPLDRDYVEGRLAPGWRAAGLANVRWRE